MRILLSEGSGLTSRQVAGRLGALGHEVEILSSTALCLTRFTRHVRAVHAVPRFGLDPFGWLDAAERIAVDRRVDLLFPTQEQVTVLSALEPRLTLRTIVPSFAALMRVQDKIPAFRALAAIGAPQPETIPLASVDDLSRVKNFPAFVKRPVSTASSGVRRVKTSWELADAVRAFGLGSGELIVQTQADGPLAMVQAVAQHGRLVAQHACLRLREGVGGGAALKESVAPPEIPVLLAKLVAALDWHGGLSMDVIVSDDGPKIIDVNPRLVEPANALAAGVDLVGAMLDIAGDEQAPEQPPGRAGVHTSGAHCHSRRGATKRKTAGGAARSAGRDLFTRRLPRVGRGTDAARRRSCRRSPARGRARGDTRPSAALAEVPYRCRRALRGDTGGLAKNSGGRQSAGSLVRRQLRQWRAWARRCWSPILIRAARGAASYVDRIFKSEKSGDLPVHAPIKYELVINLKGANFAV